MEGLKITYELQAYLAASPRSPCWSRPVMDAVEGWKTYHYWKGQTNVRDARLDRGTGWVFVSAEAGASVLKELLKLPQKYHLRVARVVEYRDVFPVVGANIENGTIVDGPGDKMACARDPFWKTDPERLASIVPADRIRMIEL